MTQYHGGKQRIGKNIAHAMFEEVYGRRSSGIKGYLEPFCGMLGVYEHVPDFFDLERYKASDINESLILLWQEAKNGWEPPHTFSKRKYNKLRHDGKSSPVKGFVGHACAPRGIYFAPFTDKHNLAYSSQRIQNISQKLKNVSFSHRSYSSYTSSLKNYIIYCDPPYYKSSRYYQEDGSAIKFNHERFYKWAEKMAENNLVFISENSVLPYYLVAKFGNENLYLV